MCLFRFCACSECDGSGQHNFDVLAHVCLLVCVYVCMCLCDAQKQTNEWTIEQARTSTILLRTSRPNTRSRVCVNSSSRRTARKSIDVQWREVFTAYVFLLSSFCGVFLCCLTFSPGSINICQGYSVRFVRAWYIGHSDWSSDWSRVLMVCVRALFARGCVDCAYVRVY